MSWFDTHRNPRADAQRPGQPKPKTPKPKYPAPRCKRCKRKVLLTFRGLCCWCVQCPHCQGEE